VDAPVLGRRERDVRSGYFLPRDLPLPNVPGGTGGVEPRRRARRAGDRRRRRAVRHRAHFTALMDPTLTWADLDWLRAATQLPVLLKGIVRGDDAARAVRPAWRDRRLPTTAPASSTTAIATLDALPEVVAAVDGRAEVLLDGGVRRAPTCSRRSP
jgi:4-hydroxymandelate oxidase